MARQLLTVTEERELRSLWGGRSHLDREQWERLWQLVTSVLRQCQPTVLQQLPDTKEAYVSDFFLNKVIQGKDAGTQLESASALATFFQRYLIDIQRYLARRPTTYLDDEALVDHLADTDSDCDIPESRTSADCPGDHAQRRQLLMAAAEFFGALSREDQLYLSLHACDDDGEPLYKLAKRFEIASYHYKAGQLGITRKKGELPAGYETTRIGHWLTNTLGMRIAPDFIDEILEAFEALCEAAMACREHLLNRSEAHA